jgi:pseudaminic acid cytidylyltransferase
MDIAIIPARGGSKRIPKKNIRNFCGKPIIAYSIETALRSGLFNKVIVSTDDEEIAAISKKCGAEVPFLRPSDIADDHATTMEVIQHAIQWFQNTGCIINTICCLYATAPFTRVDDLRAAKQFLEDDIQFVFSATEFSYPIFRSFRLVEHNRVQMFWPENSMIRSQDLEKAYHDAGMFYFGKQQSFIAGRPIFAESSRAYLLPHYRVQDIDTMDDWLRAEKYYQLLENHE